MNIVICDDEENVRIFIKKLIENQDANCRIMEFSSGEELLRFWEQGGGEQTDILFLDISMQGTDGLEAAEQIKDYKAERDEAVWGGLPLLIFVTGYPEYMPKAFSVHAFQYLLKPIDEEEFGAVFAQAVQEYRYLEHRRNRAPRDILLRNGNVTRHVSVEDIYYIESSNRKIIVHMKDEETECYGKIGELENELKSCFFRIHKGYLINMKYVERYNRTELRMKNGSCILISKYKYQDFVKSYLRYISGER